LPIRYTLEFKPSVMAIACEVFDGHHKRGDAKVNFEPTQWELNVADLNNIEWA
jgi:hypothetical protein